MMMLLLAAAASPMVLADSDLHCMAAYLVVAGDPNAAATTSAEDKAGVQSLVMYYFGKLDARRPGADLESEIKQLVQAPGYAARLTRDLERCGAEATKRSEYLATFGDGQDPAGAAPPANPPPFAKP